MEKYTFVCEFHGGTYISQYAAPSLYEALFCWGHNLDPVFFNKNRKDKINKKILSEIFPPILLDGIENVWSTSITIDRSLLLLNIIKTA